MRVRPWGSSLWTVAAIALLVVTSCSSAGSEGSGGSPGADLFRSGVLGGQAGCSTCHSLTADRVIVGPSLAGVGTRAGQRIPGLSPADYLRESILNPDAFVVDGFDSGRMPSDWGEVLTDAEVVALVDFLLTQE